MLTAWDSTQLVAALGLGVLLGAVYFGGLWWTVRRIPDVRSPWLWYLCSLLVRLAIVLSSLALLLLKTSALHVLVAVCGLLIARIALTCWLGQRPQDRFESPQTAQ